MHISAYLKLSIIDCIAKKRYFFTSMAPRWPYINVTMQKVQRGLRKIRQHCVQIKEDICEVPATISTDENDLGHVVGQ